MMNQQEKDESAERMNAMVEDLDGRVMEFYEVQQFLHEHVETCREAYEVYHELFEIRFGFNDGDEAFTVSADWS